MSVPDDDLYDCPLCMDDVPARYTVLHQEWHAAGAPSADERAALRLSGRAKLVALGLSEAEVDALLGQADGSAGG